jgi:hypothetical protein
LKGKTYRIRGGRCYPLRSNRVTTPRRRLSGFSIGLFTNLPAPPVGRGVDLYWRPPATRGRAITIDDSAIEVAGMGVAASGTVVVGKRLNGGWFSLYGRDASGPTGPLVSGSWSCS